LVGAVNRFRIGDDQMVKALMSEYEELLKIFAASLATAKRNR
jgi:hypothetical protein